MNIKKLILNIFCIFFVLLSVSCFGELTKISSIPLVVTTNYPLTYFAKRIAGADILVTFPLDKEGDPAYWTPRKKAIFQMQRADLILLNGAGYETWLSRVSLPYSKQHETAEDFSDQWIEGQTVITHSHGPEGEHTHAALAFTTWLDMKLAIKQALSIKNKFSKLWPEKKDDFEKRYLRLKADLTSLDNSLKEVTNGKSNIPVLFSHPVYQYLENAYQINGKSLHWEPDVIPDEEMMSKLKAMNANHKAKFMIWEGNPLPESVKKLETIGIKSIVFNPAGNIPEKGDFLEVMKANISELKKIYKNK